MDRHAENRGSKSQSVSIHQTIRSGLSANLSILTRVIECLKLFATSDVELPDLMCKKPNEMFEALGAMLGIRDNENNQLLFWFFDTLSEIIRQSQLREVTQHNQRSLLSWFVFILDSMRCNGWTREECFTQIDLMIEVAYDQMMSLPLPTSDIPQPHELDLQRLQSKRELSTPSGIIPVSSVMGQEGSEKLDTIEEKVLSGIQSEQLEEKQENRVQMAVEEDIEVDIEEITKDIGAFIELIYDLLASRVLYSTISKMLLDPPAITTVDIPYPINYPKVLKPPPEIPKKGTGSIKSDKKINKKKGAKGSADKGMSQVELDALKELTKNKFLLPLLDAVDDNFFTHLFPSPVKASKGKKKSKGDSKSGSEAKSTTSVGQRRTSTKKGHAK